MITESTPTYELLDITTFADPVARYIALDAERRTLAIGTRAEIEAQLGVTLPVGYERLVWPADPAPVAKYCPACGCRVAR